MVASVPVTVRWPGSVPLSTTATGSDRGRPARDQRGRDLGQPPHTHVEHERPGEPGQQRPVDHALPRNLVAGDERDRARHPALGHGDARRRRSRATPGGHAGHDLEGHARRRGARAPPRLRGRRRTGRPPFSRTTIAPARARSTIIASVSSWGTDGPPRVLADEQKLSVGPRAVERLGGYQAVVEDRVRDRDQLQRPGRQQPGIAGPRADEVDAPGAALSRQRRPSPAPATGARRRRPREGARPPRGRGPRGPPPVPTARPPPTPSRPGGPTHALQAHAPVAGGGRVRPERRVAAGPELARAASARPSGTQATARR